ncbi:hypothetical protein [Runella limosa]|uniref:hypothetical protein n=1 Tax=Runella limosa TaxID=370978 RepID=UPI000412938C|nr:hypothetical protein [Runella limosa]
MPILISRASLLKIGNPFPNISSFKEALDAYNKRLFDFNNVAGVHLLDDPRVIYFTTETFSNIIGSGATHLVARFGCENDTEQYSNLSIVLCGMNCGDHVVKTDHYIGNSRTGADNDRTHESSRSLNDWKLKENNYVYRIDKLLSDTNGRNEFLVDDVIYTNGVAHEITELRSEWFDSAAGNKMAHVACYFVKVENHLSVAFADARINPRLATINDLVYDFGSGCCPPA